MVTAKGWKKRQIADKQERAEGEHMTFEKWWETLTPQEHKVIGRTNAQYVWECATQAQREIDALKCEQMGIDGYGTLAIAAAIRLHHGVTGDTP